MAQVMLPQVNLEQIGFNYLFECQNRGLPIIGSYCQFRLGRVIGAGQGNLARAATREKIGIGF